MLQDSQDKYISCTEASKIIEVLSKADWVRLTRIATSFSVLCGVAPDDLLQEAIVRALSGQRRCPRDVKMVNVLGWFMKSIASSYAKAHDRHPHLSLQNNNPDTDSDYQENLEDADQPPIQDEAIAKRDLVKVREVIPKLFERDSEEIQLMVMGILEGMDKEDIQEFSGLDGTAYDSARRLFRRRVAEAFPGGWGNE